MPPDHVGGGSRLASASACPPVAASAEGLSQREAERRLAEYGPNRWRDQAQASLLWRYLGRFRSPLMLVLLGASAVSAYLHEVADFILISLMVLTGVTLDFLLESRANAAAQKLQDAVSTHATVLRDKTPSSVPVAAIVPGDVALVSAGDAIPADGRVIAADDFFVNQAALTGEPYPVPKHPGAPPDCGDDGAADPGTVFMGSSVVSGSASIQILKTGTATMHGQIGEALARPAPPTPFERGTHQFGMLIMRLTVLMVMFVLLVNIGSDRPALDALLFAVALAVGLTPEMLPMVISVTLARGALRMAKQHVIVKRMSAIHDLGAMDVLCADKTGTLTEARVVLERHVDPEGRNSERVLEVAYLNSIFETGLKSPIDQAILAHQDIDTHAWRKIDELPFDFQRRRVAVLVDHAGRRQLVLKGAPDELLLQCTHFEMAGATQRQVIDAAARVAFGQRVRALEEEGLRVLGIAWRPMPPECTRASAADEVALTLCGFAAFLDPPKSSAGPALADLQRLGVAIKIVTGDSEAVTRHVCKELALQVDGVVSGRDVSQMDDLALLAVVDQTTLFCRVSPVEKNRIILALKARGHVVGYLGDGINDAPSLHSADIGMSVDSAVDVAREAADIILLKQDLRVLHSAVLEGRRTFGNIMKYILMVTSSNFGNMFSMAGASLFLPFLPMTPTQILLNNILYDISELAIPLDRVDGDEVRSPRALDLGFIRCFMVVIGGVSSLFDFLTFYLLLALLEAGEPLFQSGWFVESLCTQVLVIFVIRTRGNPFRSAVHPALAGVALLVLAVAIVLPWTALGAHFSLVPLPPALYGILTGLTVLYLLTVEYVKRRFYRTWLRPAFRT